MSSKPQYTPFGRQTTEKLLEESRMALQDLYRLVRETQKAIRFWREQLKKLDAGAIPGLSPEEIKR